MPLVGYGRVSDTGQSLDIQIEQLQAAGAEKIFSEKRSGASREGREALADAISWCREGDVLICTRLDRLARSVSDLHIILSQLDSKGVGFRVLQQAEIDTTSPTGRLTLNILGAVAAFELDLRRSRQMEGIEKRKAAGLYKGRPATINNAEVARLRSEGLGATEIARRLKIGRASVYRVLGSGDVTGAAA